MDCFYEILSLLAKRSLYSVTGTLRLTHSEIVLKTGSVKPVFPEGVFLNRLEGHPP